MSSRSRVFIGKVNKPARHSSTLNKTNATQETKFTPQKKKAGIVTSLNDTKLTKVTYGKYDARIPDEVVYGIYEWLSSQQNTLVHIINLIIIRAAIVRALCLVN